MRRLKKEAGKTHKPTAVAETETGPKSLPELKQWIQTTIFFSKQMTKSSDKGKSDFFFQSR